MTSSPALGATAPRGSAIALPRTRRDLARASGSTLVWGGAPAGAAVAIGSGDMQRSLMLPMRSCTAAARHVHALRIPAAGRGIGARHVLLVAAPASARRTATPSNT